MRSIGLTILGIVAAVSAAGCHAPAPTPQTGSATLPALPSRSTAALAFTPPIAQYNPAVATARDERADGAFVGYDTVTYSSVYVYQEDRFRFGQSWNGWGDMPSQFQRRSVQTMVSERTR